MHTNNWLKEVITKIATVNNDLVALKGWNRDNAQKNMLYTQELSVLRSILGDIIKQVNSISNIYRIGMRTPSEEISMRARELLNDLQDIDRMDPVLNETALVLESVSKNHGPDPQIRMLQSMIYSMMDMKFSPQQQQQFIQLAKGDMNNQNRFAAEMNIDRVNNLLQAAIYSSNNPEESTLIVFREILQNAGDAAMMQYKTDPSNPPSIDVFTKQYQSREGSYMDMMVVDNGVGMDWETMSKKFFVVGETGKSGEPGSTGGFGIAKAKIFETPEHGWSIDTRGIHSSRFGRNIYMGTNPPTSYQPPKTRFHQGKGAAITLYKLPAIYDYSLVHLAERFATDDLQISVNGKKIATIFSLSDMKPLGDNLTGVIDELSESSAERNSASNIVQKELDSKTDRVGDFKSSKGNTTVNFYIRKKSSGRVYILLNGQYQFENDYISGADIIVSIRTLERPGSPEYPIDPGRENLRSDLKEKVESTVFTLKMIFEKITSNELFKEGLDINVYNKQFAPLSTRSKQDVNQMNLHRKLEAVINGSVGSGLFTSPQVQETYSPSGEYSGLQPEEPEQPGQPYSSLASEETPEEVLTGGEIVDALNKNMDKMNFDKQQIAIVNAAIAPLIRERDSKVNIKEIVDQIIRGVSTPASIIIQKNFVSRELTNNDPTITASLVILWQTIIKKVVDRNAHRAWADRAYIPGIIYSDKAVALYKPAKGEIPYDTIAINPVVVASIVHPGAFAKMTGDPNSDAFKNTFDVTDFDETPTNRLTNLLFHTAIHEVCHLLHPDSYGSDEFHNNISDLEQNCHFMWEDIRKDVKKFMPDIKSDMINLIQIIRKDKKSPKTSSIHWEFPYHWNFRFGKSTRKFSVEQAKKIGEEIGVDWNTSAFPVEEFRIGLEVEMEHGSHDPETNVINNDASLGGKIAWAHLKEIKDYYTRLVKMEDAVK